MAYIHYLKWEAAINGEKIPRKDKKAILGLVLNKRKIAKLISDEDYVCFNCGCKLHYASGNMADYPEVYINHYCARCHTRTATQDNSPFTILTK